MLTERFLVIRKWKKLRLRVWEKRLLYQLSLISSEFPSSFQCTLCISWGPFYGGSVVLNRRGTKAKIYIQIPYDRYITADEQQVLSHYAISKNALPYFIFFHECYHLIDVLSQLQLNKIKSLDAYQTELKKAVKASTSYRLLQIERSADEFAYTQYKQLCKKAG
ncbi:hypothetical protein ACFQ88_19115 [Paenibacillus sp. NPDC056579]|uniref:hypothetical protein n=1 Tax=Paenibacillus sp. NPDC056579 TaxID=3345871 RepID=UPI0036D140A6